MKRLRSGKAILFFIMIGLVMAVVACGPKARIPVGKMDTPEHHTFTGLRLLDEAKYSEADREFELSLDLAPEYSQAHAGIGLVKAYRGDHQGAAESMRNAWKF